MKLKIFLALVLLFLIMFIIKYKVHSCEFLICARQDVDGVYGYVQDCKDRQTEITL